MNQCIYCGQWTLKATDEYCSGCGKLPLNVTVQPEKLFLRGMEGQAQVELTIHNRGAKTVLADLLVAGAMPPFLTCPLSEATPLAPGERKAVPFRLDAGLLPPGMPLSDYRFRFRLDGNDRRVIPFEVRVVPGPRPELSATEVNFGKVEQGRPAQFEVEVKNLGGLPFQIVAATVENHPEIRVQGGIPRDPIKPGASATILLVWEEAATPVGPNAALRMRFSHGLPDAVLPIAARMVSYALAADPPEIRDGCALSREEVSVTVRLVNRGTERIDITAIESNQPWLRVFSSQAVFSLLPPGAGRESLAGRNVYTESYLFNLIYMPEGLPEGPNAGLVVVHTGRPDLTLSIPVNLEVLRPEGDYPHFIGIDFGTTNSTVSVWSERENRAVLVPEEPTKPNSPTMIPSYLVFKGSPDQYDIGTIAKRQVEIYPEVACRSLKRIMGHTNPREIYGRKYQPHELAALIIRRLVRLAERYLFELNRRARYLAVRWAIVTVPADFYDAQIRGVLEAVRLSGLEVIETSRGGIKSQADAAEPGPDANSPAADPGSDGIIIDEPSAAALFFFQHIGRLEAAAPLRRAFDELLREKKAVRALIYDHGGGTLDVSILEIRLDATSQGQRIRLKILTNNGDNQVGGEYIDLAIMREALLECKRRHPAFAEDLIACPFQDLIRQSRAERWGAHVLTTALASRNAWIEEAEKAKVTLTARKTADFVIPSDYVTWVDSGKTEKAAAEFRFQLTRERMNALLENAILGTCRKVVNGAVRQSNLQNEDIDFVFHSGRTSLIPRVQQFIEEQFPHLVQQKERIVKNDDLLKVCVAMGAAQHGAMRARPNPAVAFDSLGRTLPHSYGLAVNDFFGLPVFEPIIKAGTPYPVDQGRSYTPDDIPPNGWLSFHFYQHKGIPADSIPIGGNADLRQIGSIHVNANTDGKPGADVVFRVSANRMLEVEVDGKRVEVNPPAIYQDNLWAG